MRGRPVPLLAGLGALAALIVMLVFVALGADETADPVARAAGPFPAGALTVGLQDDQLGIVPLDLIPSRVERIAASGAKYTRVTVSWVEVAANPPASPRDPADPAYAWDRYDAIFDGLSARGIEPVVAFSSSPGWGNGGGGPAAAPELDAYAAFVRAFATRYDGRSHARIRLYEPWDAPNDPARLSPQWVDGKAASPSTYAGMLRRAHAELKAASPQALVVGISAAHVETSAPPVGAMSVLDFVQGLAAAKPPMDAAAIHLEPAAAPNAPSTAIPSFATLPRLVDEIDKVASGVPVMVTRFGYATSAGGVSEEDQSAYLTQALERLAATPRIRFASWYSLQDGVDRSAGLLRPDGSDKPAWTTFTDGPKVLPSAAGP